MAVFLCVCVWLFGLAGGERAAGVVPFWARLTLHPLFLVGVKGGADLPITKSEIIVQHMQSDSLELFLFLGKGVGRNLPFCTVGILPRREVVIHQVFMPSIHINLDYSFSV